MILLGIFLEFFAIFSCKKNQSDSSEYQTVQQPLLLGFSQIGAESAWRVYNSKAIQDAAQKSGIQILFSNAEQKQENQIKAIRSFIVYRVDAIAFVPIVQDGWDNVLREAKAAHIPVIICDRKIRTKDETLFSAYIGTDSVEEGRKAAEFLVQKFENSKKVHTILEIRGTDGSSASDGRAQGFREVLKSNPNFKIIYSESGNFLRSRGREIAKSILEKNDGELKIGNKKVDIIFSANDGMTLGFLKELSDNGIKTGDEITVVTVDAQQEAINLLQSGEINCVIECKPDIGTEIMETVKKLVAGEEVPKFLHVEEQVFTENDDFSQYAPRNY